MARRTPRPEAKFTTTLTPLRQTCEQCGNRLWVAYHCRRKVMTLEGLWQLRVVMCQCHTPTCPQYHMRYHPEEEGRWALPHGEFGLDVIALIGTWRFREHRSVPEMHQRLQTRDLAISEREVTHLMHRYEELVTLRIMDHERIKARLQKQGQVILALDGLQPDVGHEVLWVVRDCLSEEILLARPLLSSTQGDLTALLTEVKHLLKELAVPVKGVISDGEETIGSAVAFVFPEVPHQLCQFHYLKDAIKPLYEADRHAKTQLKKLVRGVRPLERALEERSDPEAEAIRGYCLAVRSSLTDDGRPKLSASGLKLQQRLTRDSASPLLVWRGKKSSASPKALASLSSPGRSRARRRCGLLSKAPMRWCIRLLTFWPIMSSRQVPRSEKPIWLTLRTCRNRKRAWVPSVQLLIISWRSPRTLLRDCFMAMTSQTCLGPTMNRSIVFRSGFFQERQTFLDELFFKICLEAMLHTLFQSNRSFAAERGERETNP